jgi:FtsZ-interacting cell division protein ZipA
MASFLQNIAVPVAVIAVAIVLVLGLWNMMKGGSSTTSQKLMRMRVLLQGIAIALVMFTLWILGR